MLLRGKTVFKIKSKAVNELFKKKPLLKPQNKRLGPITLLSLVTLIAVAVCGME